MMGFFGIPVNPAGKRANALAVNRAVRFWKGGGFTVGKTQTNTTYNVISIAPCADFQWVAPILLNGEASPVTVPKTILAVTTSKTNRVVPTGGSLTNAVTENGTTGWVTATFGGAANAAIPAGSATAPSYLIGDFMRLASVAPTDGAARPYVLSRTLSPATGTFSGNFAGTGNTDNTLETYMRGDSFAGDAIATPSNLAANTGEVSLGPLAGYIFKTSTPTLSIAVFGSSTSQGGGTPTPTDTQNRSWIPMMTEKFAADGLPVHLRNHAIAGTTSTQYLAHAKAVLAANPAQIALYPPFSTNEGTPTATTIALQYANAMDFAYFCMQNNIMPVFTFLCPNNAYDATADGFRKLLITQIKALKWTVIDMVPAVGDGALPERFQAAFSSGDGTHTNDAGYQAQAALGYPLLRSLVLLNFGF